MKIVLNVAEKPSVAKEIVKFLSNGEARRVEGISLYNPINEFEYKIGEEVVLMRVTSVQGHVMGLDFQAPYNKWGVVSPEELFDVPVCKSVLPDKHDIVNNLKKAASRISMLVLWLDCDREGENIAYEVVTLVTQVVNLPNSAIRRAHFSALTRVDIEHAVRNLGYPQLALSEAVDARQEIDLRLGAIFTRLQTIRLKTVHPSISLVSWGPCQFPTLGFVVNRHLEILNFVPEKYWSIDMKVKRDNKTAIFTWGRKRLFDFLIVLVLYERCLEARRCKVMEISKNEKNKWRPVPLATIAFQKLASSKLRIDSDASMKIAEKLYQQGYISYPRTETDSFKSTINLRQLVELHTSHEDWGAYVSDMAAGGFQWPRTGSHDDNSHPPIHPVKTATKQELQGDEWKVYELITRHFLASCSQDAKGFQTVVQVDMGGEVFECKGLQVVELNFLKVYPYIKWSEADLPIFRENEEFVPSALMMEEHETQPPSYLSESDLITLMDKSGIGTDATIHQHIKTIQDRKYAEKTQSALFKPTPLGSALVVGYSSIGTSIHNPELRAKMEKSMNEIINNSKTRREVITNTLREMEEVFQVVRVNFHKIARIIGEALTANPEPQPQRARPQEPVLQNTGNANACYKCGRPGHFANNCPGAIQAKGNGTSCFKCGKEGHFANNCPNPAANPQKKGCGQCGVVGRHPKNSTCTMKKSRKK